MQITTTIEPTYRIDLETSAPERAITITATQVANPTETTEHRLNTLDVWALIQDFGREVHYQTSPVELGLTDDWDLHQNFDTKVLRFDLVGSNARVQHVHLTPAEALHLSLALDSVYATANLEAFRTAHQPA